MGSDVGLVIMATVAVLMLVGFGIGIAYLLTLQRAVERCAPQNRALYPGQVWLSLIPLFNIVWQFILVSRIADTLSREFAARSTPPAPVPDNYGRSVGLAMCVLGIVSFIPYLGILTGLASFVCWIVYWVKVSGYSRALALGKPMEAEISYGPVPDYAPAQEAVSLGTRWLVALVLAVGYGASYFQRVAPSVMAPAVRSDLHLTTVQLGLVFSAFPWGMMAGYVLMTVLTALCGTRWGLVASFVGVSLAACGSGLLPGYGGLLAARFLLGLFTGGLLPGAVQYIRDWFPSHTRPLMIGVLMAAGPAASLVAPPLLTSGVLHMGWRPVLIVTGLPTLIAAVLCLMVWPKPVAREPFLGISTFAFASAGMIALGLLFASPILWVNTSWLGMYLRRQGTSLPEIATFGPALQIANFCGALLAGAIAWAMMNGTTRPSRVRAVLLTLFGCLLPAVTLGGTQQQWVVVMASALSAIAYSGWAVLLYSAVADAFPARGVVVGAAIGGLLLLIGGMVSPMVLSMIADTHGYGMPFVVAGTAAVVGVAGVLLLAWGVRQEPAKNSSAIAGV
jgi:MFS family permease